MARIAGVELPRDKRIDYSLTLIYGIGWARAAKVLDEAGVDSAKRTKELSEEEIVALSRLIENYEIEGDLKRRERGNIQRLRSIGSYRGVRHARNLPVRGQRTRTNARTKRGKRKTVGAFKKEMLSRSAAGSGRGATSGKSEKER